MTSYPDISGSKFDDIIPKINQDLWLKSANPPITIFKRNGFDINRNKYVKRLDRILNDKNFCENILYIMRKYIRKCIPEPYITEARCWSCSCLPYMNKTTILYSRINLRYQEVFTLLNDLEYKENGYSFHLMRSLFCDEKLEELSDKFGIEYYDHFYKTGGDDQFTIYALNDESALGLLDDETVLQSIKQFNINRMRSGANPYANFHCPELADLILPERY